MISDNLGQLSQQLDLTVHEFGAAAREAAEAEAAHKTARAKRVLRARADGVRSISEAEFIAEADDNVADLYMRRLTTAAVAESFRQRINSLRERINVGRSLYATQREADRLHAHNAGGSA